jgi:hypothetical protein
VAYFRVGCSLSSPDAALGDDFGRSATKATSGANGLAEAMRGKRSSEAMLRAPDLITAPGAVEREALLRSMVIQIK